MPTMEDVTCISKLFVAKICLCVCVCVCVPVWRSMLVCMHILVRGLNVCMTTAVHRFTWRLCLCAWEVRFGRVSLYGPISLAKEKPQPVRYKSDGTNIRWYGFVVNPEGSLYV